MTRIIIASRSCSPRRSADVANASNERRISDFIGTPSCAGAAKRKEPEIVAQMNLKYCRSTSLSPVSGGSALFPTFHYLTFRSCFYLRFTRGTVPPGTIPFLLPIPSFVFFFTIFSFSPSLSLSSERATRSMHFEFSDRMNSPDTPINRVS